MIKLQVHNIVYAIIAGFCGNLKHSASKLHFTLLKHKCLEIPQLRIYISVSGYITTDSAKQKIRIFADTKI